MKNKLRELRARERITQEELARRVGVSRQTILAIEGENYNPSLELGFKIAKVFKIRVDEVFSV